MARKRKIAFLALYEGAGGTEVALANLIRGLSAERYDAHLIAPPGQAMLTRVFAEAEFTIMHWDFPTLPSTSFELGEKRIFNPFSTCYVLLRTFLTAIQLSRWLNKHEIEALYSGTMVAHLINGTASKFAGCKSIWHIQDIMLPRLAGGLGPRMFGILSGLLAHLIVTPSKAVGDSLPHSENITVIPHGIDMTAYPPDKASTLREELELSEPMPLIGLVGRLRPQKGHRVLLEAVAQLIQQGINCHVVIVGASIFRSHHYRQELETLCANLDLHKHVSFTGLRDDIPNVMRGLDIVVVPSLKPESFGLVNLEAMASMKPVIASRSGGIPEIVVDEETGILIPPGDVDALAAALKRLLEDPALRLQFGKAGYIRAQHFTPVRYITDFEAAIEQTLR